MGNAAVDDMGLLTPPAARWRRPRSWAAFRGDDMRLLQLGNVLDVDGGDQRPRVLMILQHPGASVSMSTCAREWPLRFSPATMSALILYNSPSLPTPSGEMDRNKALFVQGVQNLRRIAVTFPTNPMSDRLWPIALPVGAGLDVMFLRRDQVSVASREADATCPPSRLISVVISPRIWPTRTISTTSGFPNRDPVPLHDSASLPKRSNMLEIRGRRHARRWV